MTALPETRHGLSIVRRLDAPREEVFRAWTEPEQLDAWFANGSAPVRVATLPTTVDLRVGGEWRLHMVENAERSYVTGGIYEVVSAPDTLAFGWGAVGGWPEIDPAHLENAPLVTVTLYELDGATEMVLRVDFGAHLSDEQVQAWLATGMRAGWLQTLDRLVRLLSGSGAV